jgi:hypothetical protein
MPTNYYDKAPNATAGRGDYGYSNAPKPPAPPAPPGQYPGALPTYYGPPPKLNYGPPTAYDFAPELDPAAKQRADQLAVLEYMRAEQDRRARAAEMSIGLGGASQLPTGPLPGETYEQYQYRKYAEQRALEQQAEQRAYQDWQQRESRAYSDYKNEYQQADQRAYGDFLSADQRAYSEARQRQADAERRVAQEQSDLIRLAQSQGSLVMDAGRNQVNLADRYAAANMRGRQSAGSITPLYKRTLGGY